MRRAALPIVFLTLVLMGCVRQTAKEFDAPIYATADDAPSVPGAVGEVVVAQDDESGEAVGPAAPNALPPGRSVLPDPTLFRLGAGYGALGQVDLARCRDQGLPAGYLRMRVTFRHSGRIVRAAVESSVIPPQDALVCIGELLEVAMVPMFDGDDVTLSKSFFVN